MTNYTKWLLRSRALLFTGAAVFFPTVYAEFRCGLSGTVVQVLIPVGLCLIGVGMLDSFGLVQRKWVKAAIREENARMRSGG